MFDFEHKTVKMGMVIAVSPCLGSHGKSARELMNAACKCLNAEYERI